MDLRALLSLLVDAVRLPFRRAQPARSLSTDAGTRKDELHGLAAGVARGMAVAKVRGLVQRGRREEIEREALERLTKQVVANLGQMKGLTMKLGQQASYVNALPEKAERELAELQASVPPLEPEQLDALLNAAFGPRLKTAFTKFDRKPLAAASIGQVHRAQLPDGRQVAVKLQYPGVDEAMRADLENLEELTKLSAMSMKADMGEYTRSLNESLMRELDYEAEQRNQQRLADLYRDHPFVLVPNTVPELCGPTVLVTELVEGRSLYEAVAGAGQAQRDDWAEVMYRFAFGCIAAGFFSGDPHPGNYLFANDGRVAFIDFGMVIELKERAQRGAIAQLLAAGLAGEPSLLADGLRRVGMLPAGVDPKGVWAELVPLIAGPIDGGPVRLNRDWHKAAVDDVNKKQKTSALANALTKSLDLQAWTLLWLRYSLGALATITKLEPELDWRQLLSEIVLGAQPAGQIGARWGEAPGGHLYRGSQFAIPGARASKAS
jgi:predicted unusual protein kinase regulating ubiquinone biosynthesis (AarF/ABC1/UbiB family)